MNKGFTALILPGGGARGAYQVGVLKAVREIAAAAGNPFPIICGTSAGAINATVLASHAHEFGMGVDKLEHFWSTMRCSRVYRTDFWSVLKSAVQWALSLSLGGNLVRSPKSLLDNEPLRGFLEETLQLEGLDTAINNGQWKPPWTYGNRFRVQLCFRHQFLPGTSRHQTVVPCTPSRMSGKN